MLKKKKPTSGPDHTYVKQCLNGNFCILCQALPYVVIMIAMLFFVYAVIGMQVRISCTDKQPDSGNKD